MTHLTYKPKQQEYKIYQWMGVDDVESIKIIKESVAEGDYFVWSSGYLSLYATGVCVQWLSEKSYFTVIDGKIFPVDIDALDKYFDRVGN